MYRTKFKKHFLNKINNKNKISFSSIKVVFLVFSLALSPVFSELNMVWGNTVVATVNVGDSPQVLEYNADNGNIYVSNFGSGDVTVIDGTDNSIVTTLGVGELLQALEYNADNGNIYVANFDSDTVSVIRADDQTPPTTEPPTTEPPKTHKPTLKDGILGSGNNINLQAQSNSGNNILSQDRLSSSIHSDQSIFQELLIEQDSQVES